MDPRWRLLHGSQDMILGLAKGSLYCAEDLRMASTGQEVLHTEKVFLIDRQDNE